MNYATVHSNEIACFNAMTSGTHFSGPMTRGEVVLLNAARESWREELLTEEEFLSVSKMFIRDDRRAAFVRWIDSLKALHIAARERAHVSDRDVPTGCVA